MFEPIPMSEELCQFYIDLLQWINDGFPRDIAFQKTVGLCSNLEAWGLAHDLEENEVEDLVDVELARQFNREIDEAQKGYPFNEGDHHSYKWEQNKYGNQARLDWIHGHAAQAAQQLSLN